MSRKAIHALKKGDRFWYRGDHLIMKKYIGVVVRTGKFDYGNTEKVYQVIRERDGAPDATELICVKADEKAWGL